MQMSRFHQHTDALSSPLVQIEHHLFPCVNHWHLRSLQPHVAALAAKHGVHYTVSPTISEAFIKLWHHLDIMGRKPQPGQPGSKEYADANRASKSKMDKGRQ